MNAEESGELKTFPVVDCNVVAAVIFSDRTEIRREFYTSGQEGIQHIAIHGFPDSVDRKQFHVSIGNEGTILEVQFQCVDSKLKGDKLPHNLSEQYKKALQQYEQCSKALDIASSKGKYVSDFFAKTCPLSTDKPGKDSKDGEDVFLSLLEPTTIENYFKYASALTESNISHETELLDLQLKKEAASKALENISESIEEETCANKMYQAVISLYLEEDAKFCLNFSYTELGGTWDPSYDLHIDPNSNDITLKYYGNIQQVKQENWSEIQLSLSTGKSSLLHSAPELPVSVLSLQTKKKTETKSLLSLPRASSEEILQPEGNILFVLSEKISLDPNRTKHRIPITEIKLTATFKHRTVPKLQQVAYFSANVTNTSSKYHLLAGTANIFFNGKFRGKTKIPNVRLNERFVVPFGVDPSVKIEYKTVKIQKDSHAKECITFSHITIIKNKKDIPVDINIIDQLPESTEDSIKVKLLEPIRTKENQLSYNRENNPQWFVTVPENSSLEIPYAYSIESSSAAKIHKNFSW